MKTNEKRINYWLVLKRTVMTALPLSLIAGIIIFSLYRQEVRFYKMTLEANEKMATGLRTNAVVNHFKPIISDLSLLAREYELHMSSTDDGLMFSDKIIDEFMLFSDNKSLYDQVRLLNNEGIEIIRVNRSGDSSYRVPDDQLQSKTGRYYLQEALRLRRGETYVSPFDLNIEHGKVEEPRKPIIRFATPLFFKNGRKKGLIVINYMGGKLLQTFKQVVVKSSGKAMMVNSKGYCFIGSKPEDEWGFMFDDGKEKTFENTFPDIWQKMQKEESGNIYSRDGLFTFKKVYPLVEALESSSSHERTIREAINDLDAMSYEWTIISRVEPDLLKADLNRIAIKSLAQFVSIFSIILLVCWVLARSRFVRLRIEDELKRSEASMANSQRIAHFGNWDWNIKTDEISWTDEIYNIFGLDRNLFSPNYETFIGLIHPDDKDNVKSAIDKALYGGKKYNIDHRIVRKDGSERTIHEDGEVRFDISGTPVMMSGTMQDITEQKLAEEKLVESEERYHAIFKNAADAILLIDPETLKLVEFNDEAHENLGYTRDEFKRLKLSDIEVLESHEEITEHVKETATSKDVEIFETKHRRKDGECIDVLVSATHISLRGKDYIHGIWRDITDRKAIENDLINSNKMLSMISDIQSRFILSKDTNILFNNLLNDILSFTESEYGFIGEVLYSAKGKPYLKTCAITNIVWNDETRELYDNKSLEGMEFHNLKTLFGTTITTGKTVISNDPANDPRSGGLPEGHPLLNTFMGMPFHSGQRMVGMVGIANRPEGYSKELAQKLTPFLLSCANITDAFNNIRKRHDAEEALHKAHDELEERIKERTAELAGTNKDLEMEVAERKRAEEAIREKSLLNKTLMDSMPCVAILLRAETREIIASNEAADKVGAVPGKKCFSTWGQRDDPCPWCLAPPLWETGEDQHLLVEALGIIWDAHWIWVDENMYFHYAIDITESKKAEDALRQSEERLRTLTNTTPTYIYEIDSKGTILFANRTYEGLTRDDVEGTQLTSWYPDDLKEEIESIVDLTITTREVQKIEYTIPNLEGELRSYAVNTSPVRIEGHENSLIWTSTDVTDLKRTEKELENIFNLSPDMVCVCSPSGRFLKVNESCEKILGYTINEILELGWSNLIHPDDAEKTGSEVKRQLKGEFAMNFTNRFRCKDGTYIMLEWQATPVIDGIVYATARDITERKKAEEKIRRLSRAVEQSTASIMITDVKGNLQYVNPGFTSMTGYTYEEVIGKNPRLLKSDEHPKKFYKELWQKITSGSEWKGELCNKRKNGELYWERASISPILNSNKEIEGFLAVKEDITEHKNANEKLRFQAQLLDNVRESLVATDMEGRVVYWGKGAEVLYQYKEKEVLGKTITFIVEAHDEEQELKRMKEVMKKGSWRGQYEQKRKDGSKFWGDTSIALVKDSKGEPFGFIGIDRDVTEIRKDRIELEKSQKEMRDLASHLQEVREEERTIVARDIHDELGQTLTAIKFDLSWLGKNVGKEQKTLLERINESLNHSEDAIQAIKRISSELRPTVLDDLGLLAAIEWFAGEFEKRTEIECKVIFAPWKVILSKEITTAVFRIIQESLTNVARHSGASKVTVSLKGHNTELVLNIKDNGKGMSKKGRSVDKSFGIIGMRERVYPWGGEFKISGPKGKGVTVRAVIPLVEKLTEGADSDKDPHC